VLQLNEQLLLGLKPRKLCVRSALSNLTQRSSDMGESQHEPPIKICKAQKVAKLSYSGRGWLISNDLDLSQIHMHAMLIYDVTQMLDLADAKGAFFQIGTHFVLLKCLKYLPNVLQMFFPTLVEDEVFVQINKHE